MTSTGDEKTRDDVHIALSCRHVYCNSHGVRVCPNPQEECSVFGPASCSHWLP